MIKAVDEYQDLLRISVAYAGNDHRLGANEAPPAIVSMFLGDELQRVLEALENDEEYDGFTRNIMEVGVNALPKFTQDSTDRNRTSPFAFTGNKFEFRMLGSSASISECNVVINTIVAESLRQFADILDKSENFDETIHKIIQDVIKKHKRIIFNGNGYDEAWHREAEKRGLLNLKTTPDALPHYMDEKNVKLFTEHKVLSEEEMRARYEIYLSDYSKVINVEGRTMVEMVNKDILPAISAYTKELAKTVTLKWEIGVPAVYEAETAKKLSQLSGDIFTKVKELEGALCRAKEISDSAELAVYYKDNVVSRGEELRELVG